MIRALVLLVAAIGTAGATGPAPTHLTSADLTSAQLAATHVTPLESATIDLAAPDFRPASSTSSDFTATESAPVDPTASGLTPGDFTLRTSCPPGFEKTHGGVCELRTLYQFYDSLKNRGLGGTRTALPPHRDGFTPQQIDLGRYLFFDPVLSGDGSLSCASCHDPARGLSDGRPRSIGIHGKDAGRAAPTLWNVAFLNRFFWDARADSLEAQAAGPLYSSREMGNAPAQLLASLNDNAIYRRLFQQAFPNRRGPIAESQVFTALAAFQTSLVSLNSRYDRYVHGYDAALSEREIEGLNVFRSFVARCSECHTPPLFTNEQIAVIGMPEPAGHSFDSGAEAILGSPKLKGGFKVPTLRNIARTAPYSHSGAFSDLHGVVGFYNKGRGNSVPKDVRLYLHWHISDPKLTDVELERIVDFLGALTDETFLPQRPARLPSGLMPTLQAIEAVSARPEEGMTDKHSAGITVAGRAPSKQGESR